MIKYKLNAHNSQANNNVNNNPHSINTTLCNNPTHICSKRPKRQRNKERTIKDVLQSVRLWRKIHNNLDKDSVSRVSLQDAAKVVGISKKSLDDYFSQLRLAEEYGFDFQMNMDEKIGVMRSYVKKQRAKAKIKYKQERLPKRLKVLEDFMDGENDNGEEKLMIREM